jgi:hypothetical protein
MKGVLILLRTTTLLVLTPHPPLPPRGTYRGAFLESAKSTSARSMEAESLGERAGVGSC